MAIIDSWFAEGLRQHQDGNFESAKAWYEKVLQKNHRHVDANSLIGALFLQNGELNIATQYLEKAIRLQPDHFVAHNNLGHAYHDLGDLPKAVRQYRKALASNPSFTDALNNLGCALREQGQWDEAATVFQRLLEVDASYAAGYYNLALVLKEKGDIEAAIPLYLKAIALHPNYADAYYQLANAYREQKQLDEAVECYLKVLALEPRHAAALSNLGVAKHKQGKFAEALELYHSALEIKPEDPDIHINLGSAYVETGKFEVAITYYETALKLRPDDPQILSNFSNALMELERLAEAEDLCRQALNIDPECWESHLNLGVALYKQGHFLEADQEFRYCKAARPDDLSSLANIGSLFYIFGRLQDAVECHTQILQHTPRDPYAHWNRGLALLALGRLIEGWEEFDWGTQLKERALARRYVFPIWAGSDLRNKTILVYAEQGLGDEILFASCLPDLIQRAGRVIIQCDPRLAALYARSFPTAYVHGGPRDEDPGWLDDAVGRVDLQIPVGSLPRYLRTTIESFPKENKFLVADSARRTYWQKRLDACGNGLKVGIAWRSNLQTALRKRGYLKIQELLPLLRQPGVIFINLQYDECQQEIDEITVQAGVKIQVFNDLDLFNDLDDSSALIAALDLVIVPAIATYNFAAGLGVPTWLLGTVGGWVNLGTEIVPWYPTLRLFKPPQADNWKSVVQAMAEALAQGQIHSPIEPEAANKLPITAPALTLRQLCTQGLRQHQAGQYNAAESSYQQALSIQADDAEALFLLGTLYSQTERHTQAFSLLEKAHNLLPDNPQVLANLGVVCHDLGRDEQEIRFYQSALAQDASFLPAQRNLVTALHDQGKLAEAKNCVLELLRQQPEDAEGYYLLGKIQRSAGELVAAEAAFTKALSYQENYGDAAFALAESLYEQGKIEDAIIWYQLVIERQPENSKARINLGILLYLQGDFNAAIAEYEYAIALNPDQDEAHNNLALVLLALGDLTRGWPAREHRLEIKNTGAALCDAYLLVAPKWQGESLRNKTILVHGEQGLGDEILFASCLPDLLRRAGRVILQCDPRLAPLYTRSFPQAIVHGGSRDESTAWLHPFGTIDYQCPVGSLPAYLRPTLASFPKDNPFLRADSRRRTYWKTQLQQLGTGLKIGIAWRSYLQTALRQSAYLTIHQLDSLLNTQGVQFINLQYDECQAELATAQELFGVNIHVFKELDLFNDLDNSVALMAELDLVVCPAISTYNLAAGVGTPTWLLTGTVKGWLTLGANEMPWYPTVRLFQQPQSGDWLGAINAVAAALQSLTAQQPGRVLTSQALQPIETVYGWMLLGDKEDLVSQSLREYGEYAVAEAKLLNQLIKSGSLVLDVAAHLGELTLPLAKYVGMNGCVLAFESEQRDFQRLCANVLLNGLEQVQIRRELLTGMSKASLDTPTIPLDQLALTQCDLIRVGRGADPVALLSGAQATLHRCKPFLFLEVVTTAELPALETVLKTIGYASVHHPIALFNPSNMRGRMENCFGATQLPGLIGYPLPH